MLLSSILLTLIIATVSAREVDYTKITTKKGDVLPDFSYVGYRQGDHKLPSSKPINASVVILPSKSSSDDQTKTIQAALDKVSANGGGVVELAVGKHYIAGASIVIPSKTWLRGADVNGTVVYVKGKSRDVFSVGTPGLKAKLGKTSPITTSYVAIGSSTFSVKNASLFQAGQEVYVQRPASAAWIRANGMADLYRDGKHQTWIKPGTMIKQPRTITAISGATLTLDVPLTDNIDSHWGEGQVRAYTRPEQTSGAGIEAMHIVLQPSCSGKPINDAACTFKAITFQPFVTDSWASAIKMTGFLAGFVNVLPDARRISLESLISVRDKPSDGSHGWGSDISIGGTQVLARNCASVGVKDARSFAVSTGSQVAGPNAVINLQSSLASQIVQPHMRWAHGLLVDNSQSGIEFINRNTGGSGHGWTINAAVAWNSGAEYNILSPPLGVNWGIGMRGKGGKNVNGTLIATGEMVTPKSLYAAQLKARRNATRTASLH